MNDEARSAVARHPRRQAYPGSRSTAVSIVSLLAAGVIGGIVGLRGAGAVWVVSAVVFGAGAWLVRRARRGRQLSGVGATGHYGVWIATAATLVAANAYAPGQPTINQRLLASMIVVLAVLPAWLWLRGRDLAVPFLPAFAAIYALYYAMAVFLRERYTLARHVASPIMDAELDLALWLGLLGLVAVLAGYWLVAAFGRAGGRRGARIPRWEDSRAEPWLVPLGILGLGAYAVELSVDVPPAAAELVSLAADGSILAAVGLFVLWRRNRLRPKAAAFLWFLVPARVLLGFGTGLNLEGVEVLLVLGLAAAALGRRVAWSFVGVGIAVLIVLQPVKTEYRVVVQDWAGVGPLVGAIGYVATAGEVLTHEQFAVSDALDEFMSRHGYAMTFAEVVGLSPERVPYWKGATYVPLLTKPIPRLLLPDKPLEVTGQTFGHRYGLLDPADRVTSYNMPQLIELYANFGPIGVGIGMALLGGIYRGLAGWLLSGSRPPDAAAITACTFVMSTLLLIESSASSVLGGALYRWLLLLLLGWATQRSRFRPPGWPRNVALEPRAGALSSRWSG